ARVIGRAVPPSTSRSATPMLDLPRSSRALRNTFTPAAVASTTGSAAWVDAHPQSCAPSQMRPIFFQVCRAEFTSQPDLIAALCEQLCRAWKIHPAVDGVLHDDGASTNQRPRRDRDRVADGGVHADQRV